VCAFTKHVDGLPIDDPGRPWHHSPAGNFLLLATFSPCLPLCFLATFTAVHGLPAEQLPKGDVGPHLPPGGWRGSQPLRGEDGAPVLPSVRGGSTAGGSGVTPRAVDRFSSQSGAR
jgi:hypothetical protein